MYGTGSSHRTIKYFDSLCAQLDACAGRHLDISLHHTEGYASNLVNSSSPRQNGCRCATNYVFKYIFVNEKFSITINISLKFVPKGPIDNKSALVQVMVWRRTGDKPLPESKLAQITDAYMQY